MSQTPHTTVQWALVALLLLGWAVPAELGAQGLPPRPSDEPQMVDIPDDDSPAVAARNALKDGRGALRAAERSLAKAQKAEGDKREALETRARESYEEAEQYFLAAVQADPELPEAHAGLGETWMQTGETEKALQAWATAQKLSPKDSEILLGLGRCLVDLDRPSDAAQVYVMLEKRDRRRAADLLDRMRAWGEPRAAEGNKAAQGLLDWIETLG